MNCPKCQNAFLQTQRMGIDIDYCPRCRGVWLDVGELESLLERSNAANPIPLAQAQATRYLPQEPYQEPHAGAPSYQASKSSPQREQHEYRSERQRERHHEHHRERDFDHRRSDNFRQGDYEHHEHHHYHDHRDDHHKRDRSRRSKGFLGELIDLFD